MTPERWSRVKAAFASAAEAPADGRARVLADACGGDADLRGEVESLLASDEKASGRLEGSG